MLRTDIGGKISRTLYVAEKSIVLKLYLEGCWKMWNWEQWAESSHIPRHQKKELLRGLSAPQGGVVCRGGHSTTTCGPAETGGHVACPYTPILHSEKKFQLNGFGSNNNIFLNQFPFFLQLLKPGIGTLRETHSLLIPFLRGLKFCSFFSASTFRQEKQEDDFLVRL